MFLGQIIADILLIKKLPTFVKPQDFSTFSQNDGTHLSFYFSPTQVVTTCFSNE
jgi:hypothetical protein